MLYVSITVLSPFIFFKSPLNKKLQKKLSKIKNSKISESFRTTIPLTKYLRLLSFMKMFMFTTSEMEVDC